MQKMRLSMDWKSQTSRQTHRRTRIRCLSLLSWTLYECYLKDIRGRTEHHLEVDTQLQQSTGKSPEPQTDAVVLELDEMWHYLKKKTNSGSGRRFLVIPENSSHGNVVIEIKPHWKNFLHVWKTGRWRCIIRMTGNRIKASSRQNSWCRRKQRHMPLSVTTVRWDIGSDVSRESLLSFLRVWRGSARQSLCLRGFAPTAMFLTS